MTASTTQPQHSLGLTSPLESRLDHEADHLLATVEDGGLGTASTHLHKYYSAKEDTVRDTSHLVLLPGVLAQLQHDLHGLRPRPGQQPQDERRAAELVRLVAQLPTLLAQKPA